MGNFVPLCVGLDTRKRLLLLDNGSFMIRDRLFILLRLVHDIVQLNENLFVLVSKLFFYQMNNGLPVLVDSVIKLDLVLPHLSLEHFSTLLELFLQIQNPDFIVDFRASKHA